MGAFHTKLGSDFDLNVEIRTGFEIHYQIGDHYSIMALFGI